MTIIDTNIILRYLLNDHAELSLKAKDIMLNNEVLVLTQVLAEVIYVLKGVYKSTRSEISEALLTVCEMDNVHLEDKEIVMFAIHEFLNTNLDFVDLLLYSYPKFTNNRVLTFDNKLRAKLDTLPQNN